MKETMQTIIEWHKKTFPDATLDGQLQKFIDERAEYEAAPRNSRLAELADMFVVAVGICRFDMWQGTDALADCMLAAYNHNKRNVRKAIDKKMAINRARKWNGNNGYYQHKEESDPEIVHIAAWKLWTAGIILLFFLGLFI